MLIIIIIIRIYSMHGRASPTAKTSIRRKQTDDDDETDNSLKKQKYTLPIQGVKQTYSSQSW